MSSGGEPLAEAPAAPGGTFAWLHAELDGGSAGRDIDLEFSGTSGQHWHLNAFVLS